MNKLISFLLIFSLLFPQEVCEGECYTDEEAQNIELYITELEQNGSRDSLIINNLNEQLQLYLQQTNIDSTIIENYIEQLKLKEKTKNMPKKKSARKAHRRLKKIGRGKK